MLLSTAVQRKATLLTCPTKLPPGKCEKPQDHRRRNQKPHLGLRAGMAVVGTGALRRGTFRLRFERRNVRPRRKEQRKTSPP